MDKPNIDLKKLDIRPSYDPLTVGLSKYLKDPANYDEIRKIILKSFATNCSHGSPAEMAVCSKCTEKMLERRKTLKRLGFKNPAQYMAWQKIHTEIKARFPLVDWKKVNAKRLLDDMKNK